MAFTQAVFEGDLLRDSSREQLTTVAAGQDVPYGLAWFVRDREGRRVYSHDGGINGFVTSLEYYTESKLCR